MVLHFYIIQVSCAGFGEIHQSSDKKKLKNSSFHIKNKRKHSRDINKKSPKIQS